MAKTEAITPDELTTDLGRWLYRQWSMSGKSVRQWAIDMGTNHQTLLRLMRGENEPTVDTLSMLAHYHKLPLVRLLELAGYDLGLTRSQATARLQAIADQHPQLQVLLDALPLLSDEQVTELAGYASYRFGLADRQQPLQQDTDRP